MPSISWYLRRLQTMSAAELAWRVSGQLGNAQLWARMSLGVHPGARRRGLDSAGACREPGFRVCDVRLGEWARAESEEQAWRERLVSEADRLSCHRLSFFRLVDAHLGDPIDWNRDHESRRKAPLGFAPLIDYRDCRVAGDAKLVWEPNRHHHLVVLGRAYRATGDARYVSAVIEQLESWI